MKKSLLLIILVMLCCGCSSNKNNRQVNVLNWSSYIPSEVILDFEKETGIYCVSG